MINTKRISAFLFAWGLIFSCQISFAQINNLYKVTYNDSLVLDEGSRILNSVIKIENINKDPIRIGVAIRFPDFWNVISKIDQNELQSLFLKPCEKRIIHINLLQTPKVTANWDSLRVKVWNCNSSSDTNAYYPKIKVKEKPGFYVQQLTEEQNLSDQKLPRLLFKALLKNTGNINDEYYVTYSNELFALDNAFTIKLPAGKDTTLEISAKITRNIWKQIYEERVILKIVSKKTNSDKYIIYKIKKPKSRIHQNILTHKVIPISIGGGILAMGNEISYFGQLNGQMNFGKHLFTFNYRTKDLGSQAYTYQPNTFYISYSYKSFQLEGGQIQGPKNFYTLGQGMSIRYFTKGAEIVLSGLQHLNSINNSTLKNDDLFGSVNYKINDLIITHRIESNFDKYYNINSYLLVNDISIVNTKRANLKMFAGGGFEDKLLSVRNGSPRTYGFSGGYNANISVKKFALSSYVKYYSSDYPGIYKGLINQNAEFRYYINRKYVGIQYNSNAIERNTLRDTLYNSDYLSMNSTKYGGTIGFNSGVLESNIAAGIYQQKTQLYDLDAGTYFDGNFSWRISKHSQIRIGSYNAIKPQENTDMLFITNSYLNFDTKYITLYGSYNRVPKSGEGNIITAYSETINGGPTVNFSLFNHTFAGSVRYTIAKTLAEETIRSGVGGQVNYINNKAGLTIGLNGFYPLKDPSGINLPITETRYGSLYMYKRINIPVKKFKYYDLKVNLYNDENNNGQLDSSDKLLRNAIVVIEQNTFKSDNNGQIEYKNVHPGVYNISLLNTKLGDLVPVEGGIKAVDLHQDEEVSIAFRKGKKIYGNLQIATDSLSNTKLTPENFKIIIKDTSDRVYYAITDQSGNFYMFIPEGIYHVSLNPEAFASSDYTPEVMSYEVDMYVKKESFVQFTVKQKKRKIRMMESKK